MSNQFDALARAGGPLVVADSSAPTRGVDIAFKVKKTLRARGGTLRWRFQPLRGAPPRDRRAPRRSTCVSLDAGYRGPGGRRGSSGDLRKAVVAKSGADWSVRVTAGSGRALRASRAHHAAFAAGTSLVDVVRHLAESMGVGVGNAAEALRTARFPGGGSVLHSGTVIQGRAAEELERICTATGFSYSVQDGVLPGAPARRRPRPGARSCLADHGPVESPEIVNRRTITVKALLQIRGSSPGSASLWRARSSVGCGASPRPSTPAPTAATTGTRR